jgi:putative ABC transport system permease protein
VNAVSAVLPATANPQSPGEVQVSNPSDVIKAKKAADTTLTALLLGLGGVALLVGGIGIANVMVISVLERRTEIGVRRALGATKGHVRTQFLVEAILLSALGGVLGILLGITITAGYAALQTITFSMPVLAAIIGFGAALVVGALAGISPAGRAARLSPADAIRPA